MKTSTIRRIQSALSVALAVSIGVIGALSLSHYSVCEQEDRMCMFTGVPSK